MGLTRWLQCREVRYDLRIIRQLDQEARSALCDEVYNAMARIAIECRIAVDEILFSESYHPIENGHWAQAAVLINTRYRLPLIWRAKQGDDVAMLMQLAAGVILHSVRAIMDFEMNNRTEILMYTKSIWYYLANGNFDLIPPRFQSSHIQTK